MKKYLELLKEHFSLIVSIPPLLGAIWQLLKLSQISPSYIRFFSISQMLPDGIIILIVMFILSVFFILNYIIWKKNISFNDKKEIIEFSRKTLSNSTNAIRPNKFVGAFLLFISLIIPISLYALNVYLNKNIEGIYLMLFVLPLNFIVLILTPFIIFKGDSHLKLFDSKFSSRLALLSFGCIIYSAYLIVTFYYSEFNKKILFPNNLVNQSKIENSIKTEFPNTSIKLLYNNDKYLFYSIIDPKKKTEKIKIVSFEKLFEN